MKIEPSNDLMPWKFVCYDAEGAVVVEVEVDPKFPTVVVPKGIARIVVGPSLFAAMQDTEDGEQPSPSGSRH
jgi:hypothetical protein